MRKADILQLLTSRCYLPSKYGKLFFDCFPPHQWLSMGFFFLVFIIKSVQKGGLFILLVPCVQSGCHSAFGWQLILLVNWVQMGIIQSAGIHLGFCQDVVVWEFVSADPWPRPAESQCVSFYGNGEKVTTSQQRPAACRLLYRAHLQKTGGPCEMGSDPSSHGLSQIWSYIDIELALTSFHTAYVITLERKLRQSHIFPVLSKAECETE